MKAVRWNASVHRVINVMRVYDLEKVAQFEKRR